MIHTQTRLILKGPNALHSLYIKTRITNSYNCMHKAHVQRACDETVVAQNIKGAPSSRANSIPAPSSRANIERSCHCAHSVITCRGNKCFVSS